MTFDECKIVIYNNIILMKKHWKFSGKMHWKFSENFPEKYVIFRTIFPPHITR